MQVYLFPIEAAIITFLAVAGFLVLPNIIWQYRKYGSVSIYRSLIFFSFMLYMLVAYYLIILPLPDPNTLGTYGSITQYMNLMPFQFVYAFITQTSLNLLHVGSYLTALAENVFIQPVFNLFLTIPFGIYLAYYFKMSWKKVLLFSFLLSLFFELTQLTALYGLYARPYRLFDVDDLILNTSGGLAGFYIYKHWLLFLPTKEKLDEKSLIKSEKVGYMRRGVAFIIDYVIVWLYTLPIINLIYYITGAENNLFGILVLPFSLIAYFILVQSIFKVTIGQRIVNLKLVSSRNNANKAIISRYAILCLMLLVFSILRFLIDITYHNGIFAIIYVIIILSLAIDFISSWGKNQILFYERFSRTFHKNTKKRPNV